MVQRSMESFMTMNISSMNEADKGMRWAGKSRF